MSLEQKPLELPSVLLDAMPTPESHPSRYPKHEDGKKGQIYGGVCNITRCNNHGATFFNLSTLGLYCETCADAINWQKHKPLLCVDLGKRPPVSDMQTIRVSS